MCVEKGDHDLKFSVIVTPLLLIRFQTISVLQGSKNNFFKCSDYSTSFGFFERGKYHNTHIQTYGNLRRRVRRKGY